MLNSKITVQIVVLNGGKYIQHCLDAVLTQSYPHELIEINILDNGSTDKTKEIIRNFEFRISNLGFSRFNFEESKLNLGMWGGHEELLKQTQNPYVVFLSADVIMDKDFISRAVETMNRDHDIGAVQAKVYQFRIEELRNTDYELPKTIIDSCGFKIYRSRRVRNIGHGELDSGQYDDECEIFGIEGAVPVFRREALESIRVNISSRGSTEIADHDLFWYAEDLDVAWRLHLAGWKQTYNPALIAWHDRQTTRSTSNSFKEFRTIRKSIPLHKRQLEWRNIRCTIIKNDYIINILEDLIYWLPREIMMTGYLLVYEPRVLAELPDLIRLFPRMLQKRRQILSKAKVGASQMHKSFI